MKRVAFFDVDGTLLSDKSLLSFYRFFLESEHPAEAPDLWARFMANAAAQQKAGIGRDELNAWFYREHFAGLRVDVAERIAWKWYERSSATPGFFRDAVVRRAREHRARGDELVLITGSFREIVEPIARMLGVRCALVAPLEEVGGVYTGKLTAPPTIGAGKAIAVYAFLQEHGIDPGDAFGYGDDDTDVPFLEIVGKPAIVVNGSGSPIELAKMRGWEIFDPSAPAPGRISARSVCTPPSFDLRELPSLLRANTKNRLTFFGAGGKQTRSFPEVHEDACAMLASLRSAGLPVEPGKRGVIAAPSTYEWLLTALACFYAGVEVVALPETLEAGDAADSLAGLSCDFAICDARMGTFPALAALPNASIDHVLAHREAQAPTASASVQLIAFTSGSTSRGRLESFRITSESIAAFTDAFTATFRIEHGDRWIVCHPFTHIVHLQYVLGGLGWGYDVVLCDPMRVVMSGAALEPSVLVSVPSVYDQLATQIRRRGDTKSVLGDRLKVMIIGAAPSSAQLRRFLQDAGLPLFEGYGMSETNMISCNHPRGFAQGSVGPAWPGIEIALDDEGVVLVRPEIATTREYLGVTPEQNARTFLADGWVNTGDLGRIEDGCLFITGRKKEIIVSDSAKKINVAAIESRLRELPGIGSALVLGDRRPFLVAVFAPAPGVPLPSPDALRALLAPINAELPHHERILDFLRLDEPFTAENGLLTRSGKPRRLIVAERYGAAVARLYDRSATSIDVDIRLE